MNMKNNIILVLFLTFFGFSISSCERDVMNYEGEEGVYFAVQYGAAWGDTTVWSYYPFSNLEFIKTLETESVSKLRVMSTGRIKDYDREVNIMIDKDSTTAIEGVHYDAFPMNHVIKAGQFFVDIPINIHRTEDMKDVRIRLDIKLLTNKYFTHSIPVWNSNVPGLWPNLEYEKFDNTRHSVYMSDFFIRPTVWAGMPYADAPEGTIEAGRFGQFTPKKFELMCEVMASLDREISYLDFMSRETMPNPFQDVIKEAMVTYLTEKYNAKTPVLEKDGRLMWFMGCKWTSAIGVPYVPEV